MAAWEVSKRQRGILSKICIKTDIKINNLILHDKCSACGEHNVPMEKERTTEDQKLL